MTRSTSPDQGPVTGSPASARARKPVKPGHLTGTELATVNEAMIEEAHPIFRQALREILADLIAAGYQPRIVFVRRSKAQQEEKVKQGFSKTMRSWHLDTTFALMPHGRSAVQVVRGNAADIVDQRYGWNGEAAKLTHPFWLALGRSAKAHGCSWGGDWKTFKDVAHVQMLFVEEPPARTALA